MALLSFLLKLAAVVVVVGVVWRWYETPVRLPPVFDGHYKPEYRPVFDLFRRMVEEGTERGGSFAVYRKGEPLIEVWGGYADPASKRPWREDTVTQVWSVTKGVTAISVAKLVEQGHLHYKREVREYWPDFAQNGKANVTVEMLLSHQAGLATMGGATVSLQEYKTDWKKVEKVMAAAAPEYPPGSSVGYHAITFAMYVDALIRRQDPKHRNLSQFFRDEIAVPFGIDFSIGLPREQTWRAARGHKTKPWEMFRLLLDADHRGVLWDLLTSKDSLFARSGKVVTGYDMPQSNDPTLMDVGIGSMMGFSAAGPLAKLYDYIANGGTIGTKKLLPSTLVAMFDKPLTEGLIGGNKGIPPMPFSQGFMTLPFRGYRRIGHPGYGGQQANADPVKNIGIAYVTNFHDAKLITPPDHYLELERVLYDCLEKELAKSAK